MEDVFKEFVQQAKYLMVDETTEIVGLKHRKVRLTGESTYGLSLQSMSSWFTIITITAAEPLM